LLLISFLKGTAINDLMHIVNLCQEFISIYRLSLLPGLESSLDTIDVVLEFALLIIIQFGAWSSTLDVLDQFRNRLAMSLPLCSGIQAFTGDAKYAR